MANRWAPSLALWGLALAGAGTLYLSPIPRFQADVLDKIPGVRPSFHAALHSAASDEES